MTEESMHGRNKCCMQFPIAEAVANTEHMHRKSPRGGKLLRAEVFFIFLCIFRDVQEMKSSTRWKCEKNFFCNMKLSVFVNQRQRKRGKCSYFFRVLLH